MKKLFRCCFPASESRPFVEWKLTAPGQEGAHVPSVAARGPGAAALSYWN